MQALNHRGQCQTPFPNNIEDVTYENYASYVNYTEYTKDTTTSKDVTVDNA